jgi:hypothetical protein
MAVIGIAEKKPAAEIWAMERPSGPTVEYFRTRVLPRS